MARVTGSYESITRGVSQQVPQDRRAGQCTAQVNMISDPVRGLARRRGSVLMDELFVSGSNEASVADASNLRTYKFSVGLDDFTALYRHSPRTAGAAIPSMSVFNRRTKKFLPVVSSSAEIVQSILQNGAVALVNVGRYLLLAPRGRLPSYTVSTTSKALQGPDVSVNGCVWVRAGAYSRTYRLTVTYTSGTVVTVEHTTKPSAYPGILDTSDIAATDPEYQKKVNDRVHAYNTAVSQWIGEAAEDIRPENIAGNLYLALVAAVGAGAAGVLSGDGYIQFTSPHAVRSASISDGGDGTHVRATFSQVSDVSDLTPRFFAGEVVRVVPKSGSDLAYYLRATKRNPESPGGLEEVIWREESGQVIIPFAVFAIGTVKNGVFYLGGTPADLQSMTGEDVPTFAWSSAGDLVSEPVPEFLKNGVDFLSLFQDRLVIGSGGTLHFSRPGDYFNWFRASVLTVANDDAFSGAAYAAENDTIRYSVPFDRNLVLFGDRQQYILSGRSVLTPQTFSVSPASSYENAADAAPLTTGAFVMYAKGVAGVSSMHQMYIGPTVDTPEHAEISQQLDTYLNGVPVEIAASTSPNMVFLRTTAKRNGLFVYSYLDSGTERLFDAWSEWVWADKIGAIAGLSSFENSLHVFTVRTGLTVSGAPGTWLVADEFSLETVVSDRPYLDSQRPATQVSAVAGSQWLHRNSACAVAYGTSGVAPWVGASGSYLQEFLNTRPLAGAYAGTEFVASVTPTNPYRKDRNGKAVTVGRLTLGRIVPSFADTGGYSAEVSSTAGSRVVADTVPRSIGHASAVLGEHPVVTGVSSFFVGREIRDCEFTIKGKTWLPITITSLEWDGSYFDNSRRIT